MKTDKIYYFFENKQGLWLKDGSRTKTTNDPIKAAKLTDKFEAELFCSGLNGFKVTEHLFIDKMEHNTKLKNVLIFFNDCYKS